MRRLRSRLGGPWSQDSGHMCTSVVRLQDNKQNGENDDDANDNDSDHSPRTLDEDLLLGLGGDGCVGRECCVGHR